MRSQSLFLWNYVKDRYSFFSFNVSLDGTFLFATSSLKYFAMNYNWRRLERRLVAACGTSMWMIVLHLGTCRVHWINCSVNNIPYLNIINTEFDIVYILATEFAVKSSINSVIYGTHNNQIEFSITLSSFKERFLSIFIEENSVFRRTYVWI